MRDELQTSLDERIGALELSHMRLDDDAVLTRAGAYAAAGPTSAPQFCAPTARCVTDVELELEAPPVAAGPTSAPQFCVPTGRCVTDTVLELAAPPIAAGQTQSPQTCAMTLRVGLGC